MKLIQKGDKIRCIKTSFTSITPGTIYAAESDEYYAYMCGYNVWLRNDSGDVMCYLANWFEVVE